MQGQDMGRLIRLTLILVLLTASMIVTVRLFGGTRPSPLTMVFSYPDGTPCQQSCLFGIRPGDTSAVDAMAFLQAHPLLRSFTIVMQGPTFRMTNLGATGSEKSGATIVFQVGRNGLVDAIALLDDPQAQSMNANMMGFLGMPVSLGDALLAWGAPDRVGGNGVVAYGYTSADPELMDNGKRKRLKYTQAYGEARISVDARRTTSL